MAASMLLRLHSFLHFFGIRCECLRSGDCLRLSGGERRCCSLSCGVAVAFVHLVQSEYPGPAGDDGECQLQKRSRN